MAVSRSVLSMLSQLNHVGLDLVETGEPAETVVRLPEVVEQKIPAYLELIGEELVVATLLSSKELLFSESRIRILLERPSLSYGKGISNPRLKKKTPESAQGKIRKQENCTNLPPVTLSGLRRRRKKVWVQFLMKRSYSHSMDMLAFGMKMDEQALEPGTDEIRGKHGTGHYTGGARHDRDLRFKYR
ncbi:hypothetical protein Tco_0537733 [Tanacetum coccineum]